MPELFKPDSFADRSPVTVFDLNEKMGAEVFKNDLWLHIRDSREHSLGEKLTLLKQGLSELVTVLKRFTQLDGTEKIVAASWLVKTNPRLLELMGFTISDIPLEYQKEYVKRRKNLPEEYSQLEPGYAYIEKEKFFELYDTDKKVLVEQIQD